MPFHPVGVMVFIPHRFIVLNGPPGVRPYDDATSAHFRHPQIAVGALGDDALPIAH